METSEIWRDIPGYEGLYQASSLGRIKTLKRKSTIGREIKERILKPALVSGYERVMLYKGKRNCYFVHRIIGLTFQDICGEYFEGAVIDHRNTNRTDNRADNLRWVTTMENCNNPITHNKHFGKHSYWKGKKFSQEHRENISKGCKGKRKTRRSSLSGQSVLV